MKNNEAIATFVMPAYNASEYIEAAIRSIKEQTIENWKLIVVDDGSLDSTPEKVKKMGENDSRITLLSTSQPSGSAYQPRKKAILESQTDLIAPLDADDRIEPQYLEKLLERRKFTQADIVYPTMAEEDTGKVITPKDTDIFTKVFNGKDCIAFTLDGWKINCNGGIIKKELYKKTFEKFGSSLTYSCADELLTRQLLSVTPKIAFSSAYYFYRNNPSSITRKATVKLFDFLINNRTLIEFTHSNFGEKSNEYLLAHKQNFHGYFNALRLLNKYHFSPSEKKVIIKSIKKSFELIDLRLIKNEISLRYATLIKTGTDFTRLFLKIYDKFFDKE